MKDKDIAFLASITPESIIAQLKPTYRHKETGDIALTYALYDSGGNFIKFYWVVFGLPNNFSEDDVNNENLFERID